MRVGEATLLIGNPTPRCAFPSADPDTGIRDRNVLRELIDARGALDGVACLGVYAEVLEPDLVCVGDTLEPGAASRSTWYLVDRVRNKTRSLRSRPGWRSPPTPGEIRIH